MAACIALTWAAGQGQERGRESEEEASSDWGAGGGGRLRYEEGGGAFIIGSNPRSRPHLAIIKPANLWLASRNAPGGLTAAVL